MDFLSPRFTLVQKFLLLNETRLVINDGQFVQGRHVRNFEQMFAAMHGSRDVVSCGNGLDALRIAIRALSLAPGSRIAVSAHTFFATWLAILEEGHIPIGVDVSLNNGQMSTEQLEEILAAYNDIKAVVYVHMHGILGDIGRVVEICKTRVIPLIEDCAQAHGLSNHGNFAGTFGRYGCYSFYPTKNLFALGDAGCVTVNDGSEEIVRSLANYGWDGNSREIHSRLGLNSRLDTLQAAYLTFWLKKLALLNDKRRKLALFYLEHIPDTSNLKVLGRYSQSVWHHFPLLVRNRDKFREFMLKKGISTQVHYKVACHLQPIVKEKYQATNFSPLKLPNAEQIALKQVSLPMNPWVRNAERNKVVKAVEEWLTQEEDSVEV